MALKYAGLDNVKMIGGHFGLGSKEFSPVMVYSVFQNMKLSSPMNHFTVSIEDDVSHHSLKISTDFETTVPEGMTECMFWDLAVIGQLDQTRALSRSLETTQNII